MILWLFLFFHIPRVSTGSTVALAWILMGSVVASRPMGDCRLVPVLASSCLVSSKDLHVLGESTVSPFEWVSLRGR